MLTSVNASIWLNTPTHLPRFLKSQVREIRMEEEEEGEEEGKEN